MRQDQALTPEAQRRARRETLDAEARDAAARSLRVSLARVAVFGAVVAFVGAGAFAKQPWAFGVGALAAAVFAALVVAHARIELAEERLSRAARFAERGLARIRGELDALPPPRATSDDRRATDLDLVGKGSLLSLLDAMETKESAARLLSWLLAPATPAEVARRHQAIDELAADPALVERLYVDAGGGDDDAVDPLGAARALAQSTPAPGWLGVAGLALPPLTLSLLAVGERVGAPAWVGYALLAAQIVLATRAARHLSAKLAPALVLAKWASRVRPLVRDLGALSAKSAALRAASTRLSAAADAIETLDRLSAWIEARSSAPLAILLGPLVLYDAHLGRAIDRFCRGGAEKIADAEEDLSVVLALAGLATFRYEHPDATLPELLDGPPALDVEGLAHPLLPPGARVANDVSFGGPGTLLFVTGSNMSGKSTLLRAVGVLVAMAQAGAPVTARRARLSPLVARTSLRVSDSLSRGVSHFYAELQALREITERPAGEPTLFLLDEILHGTNSDERVAGARGVLLHLIDGGAMGAVTTHDLGLAVLVDDRPGKVRPVHLLEQADGDRLVFDYKLRDGLLRSGNALRLMRSLGLPGV